MITLTFASEWTRFFTRVLDVTMLLTFLIYAIGLFLMDFPKERTKKNILIQVIKAVGVFGTYILFEGIVFALLSLVTIPQFPTGLIFSCSFFIIPIIYVFVFTKENFIHKLVKSFVIAASILITTEIGRDFGFLVEDGINIKFFIVLARFSPALLNLVNAFLLWKFDIKRFGRLPPWNVAIAILVSSMSIALAVWMNYSDSETAGQRIFLILFSLSLLTSLNLVYALIYHTIDIRHKMTMFEVQTTLIEAERESVLINEKNREELLMIRHDLKNNLSYVNVMLSEGKYEDAQKYLNDLLKQKEEYLDSFSCPNFHITSIVNMLLTKAKIADKKLKVNAVVPPNLPFEGTVLLSLITNIVDNALENFVPKNEKDVIRLSIITQQDYLRITCINSIEPQSGKKALALKTTKENKTHGYGVKIVKNIAKDNGGYISFKVENDEFVCDCLLDMTKGKKNDA